VVDKLNQRRGTGKAILVVAGVLLAGALIPLQAAFPQFHALAVYNPPEPATFALIGTALCLVSLRLRRRK
jgi:hypothetical protein